MGGKSSSSSSSSTTNNVYDNRAVVGDGGLAVTGSGSSVAVSNSDSRTFVESRTQYNNTTDLGAIKEAFGLSKVTIDGQNKTFADALGFLNKGLEFVKDQRTGYDTQVQNLTKSYDGLLNAKQTAEVAPQAELMKVAGLVLVGVIAVNAFKKG